MNVLLIMPLSYGYNKVIINTLVNRGDSVQFIPDFDESFAKRAIRKFTSIDAIQNHYIRRKITSLKIASFDVILLIRGYCYNFSTIKWMKNRLKGAMLVMYQWDPLSVSRFDKKALGLCDKLFSFDKADSKKYGMTYMPLFFTQIPFNQCADDKKNEKYDFSFVGSGHSQRLFVLGKLINIFKEKGYKYYVRVYINKLEYYRGVIFNRLGFRDFPKEYLSFKPVPKDMANEIVLCSKVVVDVHHPQQTGLSIRVMEVLGAGKNIITTNKTILDEPFYDKDAIGTIEDCQLPSNIEQLLTNKKTIDVTPYEIHNWVNTLVPVASI